MDISNDNRFCSLDIYTAAQARLYNYLVSLSKEIRGATKPNLT